MWTGEIREWTLKNGDLNGRIYNSKGCIHSHYGWEYPDGSYIGLPVYHYSDPSRVDYLPYLSYSGNNLVTTSLNNYIRLVCCDVDGWYVEVRQRQWWNEHVAIDIKFKLRTDLRKLDLSDSGCLVSSTPYGSKYWWNARDYREWTMKKTAEDKKEDEIPSPKLRSITGGLGGDGDWLSGLEEKSVFTAMRKDSKDCEVWQLHLMKRWGKSVWLMCNFPCNQQGNFLFHSLKFSQTYDMVDLLQDGAPDGLGQSEEELGTGAAHLPKEIE